MISQFQIFSSADIHAPQLNGQSGSLIDVLDACLINGYGNTAPIGWLKPIPNDPSLDLACYQQPSGSGMTLFVNDAAPLSSSIAGTKEAWVCGYERLLGLTGSGPTHLGNQYNVGIGQGKFPYNGMDGFPAIPGLGITGSLIWRKSTTIDTKERYWIMFGDAHTFYFFVQHGNTLNNYSMYMFGDIFSLKPTRDAYKCMLVGRLGSAANDGTTIDTSDSISQIGYVSYPMGIMPRGPGGGGRAVAVGKSGAGKNTYDGSLQSAIGLVVCPNPVDGAIYVSPFFVHDASFSIRGRMRGLYMVGHPITYFQDGQYIYGTGETSGKVFQVIKPGNNGGMWVIEVSNTVETNSV